MILDLREEGRTIFLTTHDMAVAERLCDRVAFIVDGEIAAVDSPRRLKLERGERRVRVEYEDEEHTGKQEFSLDGLGDNERFLALLRGPEDRDDPHRGGDVGGHLRRDNGKDAGVIRLRHAARLDLRLQARYGFYHAAALVTLLWISVLYPLPVSAMELATPLVIFCELAVIGYYFVAGMILFEKGERTLSAVVVSPLRFGEYLASKLATLTIMATVSSLILVLVAYGTGFDAALLVSGVVLTSLVSVLAGFISVLPFDQITRYLIPSQLPLALISAPLIPFLGIWQSPLFYLFPTHGPLLLLGGAFGISSPTPAQLFYAITYSPLCALILILAARRTFECYVVGGGPLIWSARCWCLARTTPGTSAGIRCC